MSYARRVLTAMREGRNYSISDIAMQTHIAEKEVGECLHLLSKGGVIECTSFNRHRKNRKYATKQKGLAL